MDTQTHHSTNLWDLVIVWVMTLFGHFTLSDAVLWLTLIYTLLRIILLIRDEIRSAKQ